MNVTIKLLLENLVMLLVNSKFAEIVARNENGRLSQAEIEEVLNDYPGSITLPPDTAYDTACVYDVYDEHTEARKVEFDLWYGDEVSDLTLSADIHKNDRGGFVISIDDIHVL
ncbi:hypothetical protein [Shewanella sp. YLB-07]|uniref:DUF7668 domain-containing protein n=1 Tax=Shewanella sp. YLB-07 TaxID=2601268 RepID=UPI00128DFB72|nr:hypothetical protein [Shewanella sp. YLB-07]MPY26900.1 hypothetical protein [Shewanella sp. YLB-07]